MDKTDALIVWGPFDQETPHDTDDIDEETFAVWIGHNGRDYYYGLAHKNTCQNEDGESARAQTVVDSYDGIARQLFILAIVPSPTTVADGLGASIRSRRHDQDSPPTFTKELQNRTIWKARYFGTSVLRY